MWLQGGTEPQRSYSTGCIILRQVSVLPELKHSLNQVIYKQDFISEMNEKLEVEMTIK